MLPRVLLAEDNEPLRLRLWNQLERRGYAVETAADGLESLTKAISGGFQLLILGSALPRVGGLEVCRALRRADNNVPVLLLIDSHQNGSKILALQTGADDCLTKPVELEEVSLRVEALLRRSHSFPQSILAYSFGPIRIDFRRTEVFRDGTPLDLSAKEFRLLQYFITNRGATLTRQKLLHEVWAYRATPSTRTVDVHVAWLRRKLEDNPKVPRWIVTVHGIGYKFLG